jgi:hypothetical protein
MLPVFDCAGRWRHWLTLVVKDPDNLAYRWERELSNEARLQELAKWCDAPRGYHFSFDLREWVPHAFRWRTGMYRVSGLAGAGDSDLAVSGGAFFMGDVPPRFRKPVPPYPRIGPAEPVLQVELKANKDVFSIGETITLEGSVQNVGDRPLMLQTRLPFLEAKLIAVPGRDTFPRARPHKALRLSDFSRLEPGQRVLLFKESFVAGRRDPDWMAGLRSEAFLAPFAGARELGLRLELSSDGIFPRDRQPDCGIWTGRAVSEQITVRMR